MARKCSVYINNEGPCSNVVTKADSNTCIPDGMRQPTKTDVIYKTISDPTGNKKGRGITNHGNGMDTECFTKTLVTKISVPVHSSSGDKKITIEVNKNIAPEIKAIFDKIFKTTKFKIDSIHTYCHRLTNGSENGDNTLSYHSYGVAIDLNAGHNPYKKGYKDKCDKCGNIDGSSVSDNIHIRNSQHDVVKIFCNDYKWHWGGLWDKPDYMHFCKLNG